MMNKKVKNGFTLFSSLEFLLGMAATKKTL
ncbi:hypothetical protein P872_04130 [Rhodonellum psychrophilum GCM71 = DSM 17998]|uniref:Uncharacterized protein n=1 Tax=Rhodonellum psychrophilum GCM71 = DSM 17998 TaxID=1123057 RepID=U5C3D4_9BACT|nr:hypothetical protein P872_04130 [Rhodonellum psychrophilum GCM71 = DSM 17998]